MRETYLDFAFTRGTVQEVAFLISLLKLKAGDRILDVGCGPGRHSLEFARHGIRAVGVDVSGGFVEVARRRAVDEGLDATFLVQDATALHFEAEFDAAVSLCEGAFGICGGEDVLLAGVHRALKPGGRLVVTVLHALHEVANAGFDPTRCVTTETATLRSPQGEVREMELSTRSYTSPELDRMFSAAGFTVEAVHGCAVGAFACRPLRVDDFEVMVVART